MLSLPAVYKHCLTQPVQILAFPYTACTHWVTCFADGALQHHCFKLRYIGFSLSSILWLSREMISVGGRARRGGPWVWRRKEGEEEGGEGRGGEGRRKMLQVTGMGGWHRRQGSKTQEVTCIKLLPGQAILLQEDLTETSCATAAAESPFQQRRLYPRAVPFRTMAPQPQYAAPADWVLAAAAWAHRG